MRISFRNSELQEHTSKMGNCSRVDVPFTATLSIFVTYIKHKFEIKSLAKI